MEQVKALTFKGVILLAALSLILTISFGVPFWHVLVLTVIIGAITYPGDLFILPRIKNFPATAVDYFVGFVIIWLYGAAFFPQETSIWLSSLVSALFLAIGEYYFHTYLATHLLPSNNRLRTDQ